MPDEPQSLTPRPVPTTALSPTYGHYLNTLPATRILTREHKADIDADEGIHPTAAESVNADPRKSLYEVMYLSAAGIAFALFLYIYFPWNYFFKASPYEIAIGPKTQEITDENVKSMGGIAKLSPVQLAVYEITKLRKPYRPNAVRDKCADYIGKIQNANEHAGWLPIWQLYLKTLDDLEQKELLLSECNRLKSLVPDAPEPYYYPVKLALGQIPQRSEYEKKETKEIRQKLDPLVASCTVAIKLLAGGEGNKSDAELLNSFRLLLSDTYRKLWWASNFSWDDPNRELALSALRQLPADSKQVIDMRLSILRDCDSKWYDFWRNDPDKRVIDGHTITAKNLEEEIQQLEQQCAK